MSSTNNDAASAETNTINVRQRRDPSGLESLPDAPLANIASFLSHTTRALFSSALTAPSTSYDLGGHNENERDLIAADIEEIIRKHGWKSAASDSLTEVLSYAIENCKITKINNNPQHQKLSKASKIVMSNPYYYSESYMRNASYRWGDLRYQNKEDWKTLDLLDLDKNLRMRLTDGDIAGILVCIDAVSNLEILRLPHCINVRGDGLSPLSGSIVLKKADLSIVSEEVDSMTPKLSINSVLPIFDGIMAKNQNSMSRLHIPKVWRDTHNERLNIFYVDNYNLKDNEEYEQMSEREKSEKRTNLLNVVNLSSNYDEREYKMDCTECNCRWNHSSHKGVHITFEAGQRIETCPNPKCGRKYCSESCAEDQIDKCDVCEKRKCRGCTELYHCECCDRDLCTDCVDRISCDECLEGHCVDCATNGNGFVDRNCGQCQQSFCDSCEPNMDNNGVGVCSVCLG